MFNYYGSKSKIIKYYPKPDHELIIEPFAGAAWYSVQYRNNDVLLNEKYDIIYNIWHWLIYYADPDIILNNSNFYLGQDISSIQVEKPHKDLIGFCINTASSMPKNIVQKWMCQSKKDLNWASTTNYRLTQIANLLPEIKHWDIQFGDYKELPDLEATWFIDPPYVNGGQHYKVNDINYEELAEWCKSRKGQVIVCENNNADWLDFRPLVVNNGLVRKSMEMIWTNY